MSDFSLLSTKLHIPDLGPKQIARPQLSARLNQIRHCRLGLLSAPAGYGKTTLLCEWAGELTRRDFSVAWLTLDDSDNDPVHFWAYLVEALRRSRNDPTLGENFLDTLRAPQAPSIEQALILLINELSALPGQQVIVLDDYQDISNSGIHSAFTFLLDHLPANQHIILSGRKDPPLPLSRYRAHGQMIELHIKDLRFNHQEVIQFFSYQNDLQIDKQDLALLEERLEGWAAGLQLTSLSLQAQEDPLAYLRAFNGDDRYILDYLIDEVLTHQPLDIQQFLLCTSILDTFNLALCEAMLADSPPLFDPLDIKALSCAESIKFIRQANLFLLPLDAQENWFRYHHIFAAALREKLQKLVSGHIILQLHRQAACWLAEQGFSAEAIQHALSAGELKLASDIVAEQMGSLVERGEAATLFTWLQAFPPEFISNDAILSLGYAWVYLYQLKFNLAEEWAQRAGQLAVNSPLANSIVGQIDAIHSTVAINRLEFETSILLSKRALENIPPERKLLQALLHLNLGDANSLLGNFSAATSAFQNALLISRQSGNRMLEVLIIGSLGELYLRQGKLHEAEQILLQALQVERKFGKDATQPLLACGKALIYLARIYLEWNDLNRAKITAEKALNYCQIWGHQEHLQDAYLIQAEVFYALSDRQTCLQMLDLAGQTRNEKSPQQISVPGSPQMDMYRSRIEYMRAYFHLREGNYRFVEVYLNENHVKAELPRNILFSRAVYLLAEYWLHLGKFEASIDLLNGLVESARQNGWLTNEIKALILLTAAYQNSGRHDLALDTLKTSLRRAMPEGFCRLFLEKDLSALLDELFVDLETHRKQNDINQDDTLALIQYAATLQAAFKINHPQTGTLAPTGKIINQLVEPLSPREIEILRLVAAGLTNDEIATTLILSNNTIKTHLKRIFARLGTSNRMEAVNKGRELKIL